jgi:hypothetical protein
MWLPLALEPALLYLQPLSSHHHLFMLQISFYIGRKKMVAIELKMHNWEQFTDGMARIIQTPFSESDHKIKAEVRA